MRAAFYETNITPPLGDFIWGYYSEHYGCDVGEDLYARAVVLEDGGEVAAIVCIDSCTIPEDMHDIVTERIFKYTGIEKDRVCISSNHTHKGASISDAPEIDCYADKEYKDVCYRLTADAVILAYKRLKEVSVSFDTVKVPGHTHNRLSIGLDGKYYTWISDFEKEIEKLGPEDDTYTVMTFKDENQKPIGCISSFPLHQDNTCVTGHYSGDFTSALSDNLKDKYGRDFVSVMLLGTCGDINCVDHDRTKNKDYTNYHKVVGKDLAEAAIKIIDNADGSVKGGIKVIKELVTFKKRVPDKETAQKEYDKLINSDLPTKHFRARNYKWYIENNKTDTVDLYMQCIKIGDVCIHILPGEIFLEIGLAIKEGSPFEKCFVVENSNSYLGYVPSKRMFDKEKDMLYETDLCFHCCLTPDAEDILIKKSIELAEKLK